MPRTLLLLPFFALAACDATNEVPSTGEAGPALAVDAIEVSISGAETVTLSGIGGGAPTASDTLRLDAGTAYSGVVRADDDDLDAEILQKAESYLFTFTTPVASVEPTDRESQYASLNLNAGDYPLGRTFRVEVADDAGGLTALTVSLVRYDGVPKTDATGTGGSVDWSVEVPVLVATDD